MTVMDERGVITVAGPFEGLDRFEARSAIVGALREQGRIVAEKRPYVHSVGHCSRCDTTVEPRLSLQWFVKVEPLAKAAGDAVRDGRVDDPPQGDGAAVLRLGRQHARLVHLPPALVGPPHPRLVRPGRRGRLRRPRRASRPRARAGRRTRTSSTPGSPPALWPFSTLGWPEETPDLEKFYPTDVLVTGYDIIFFWVARMMMFGLYAMDGERARSDRSRCTGLVRDERGKKMSKSFGNVVDPLDWMDAYGADALRFTLASGANPGTDVPIGEDWVQASRNFANKLWNATRFALMNGATVEGDLPARRAAARPTDRWILSRLNKTVAEVDAYYEDFQFAKLSDALYHFAWDEVFDWYVELAKTTFVAGGEQAEVSRRVLGEVLDVTLRLLHPIVPFVTEALWTTLTGGSRSSSPTGRRTAASATTAAEQEIELVQQVVTEVRRFRSDQGLQPGQKVPAAADRSPARRSPPHEAAIRQLLRLSPPASGFRADGDRCRSPGPRSRSTCPAPSTSRPSASG